MLLHHHQPQPVRQPPLERHRHLHRHRRSGCRGCHALGRARRGHHGHVGRHRQRRGLHPRRQRDRVALRAALLLLRQVAHRHTRGVGQVAAGDALDIGGGNGGDLGQVAVGLLGIPVDHHRACDRGGLARRGLALADHRGQDLRLGLGQLGRAHRRVAQPRHLAQQRRLARRSILAAGHDRIEHERAAALLLVEVGIRLLRHLVAVDEALVQPAALSP